MSPFAPSPTRQLPGCDQSLARGRTNFLGWLPGRMGHFHMGGQPSASATKAPVLPSHPALTAFSLWLTLLPSFCHFLLGLINKAGAHFLVLANRERAECARMVVHPGVGGRGRNPPAGQFGRSQHHTGPAAGVPDGRPAVCYLHCQLCLCATTTTIPTKHTSMPWHA